MSLIEWDDKTLSVGIDTIDSQHKILVGYINELSDGIENNISTEEMKLLFVKLVEYIQYHFNVEETYFASLNNNDLHLHKLQHKHFLEQINTFMKHPLQNVTSDLLDFLLDWLVIHIQCEDRKYIQDNNILRAII